MENYFFFYFIASPIQREHSTIQGVKENLIWYEQKTESTAEHTTFTLLVLNILSAFYSLKNFVESAALFYF